MLLNFYRINVYHMIMQYLTRTDYLFTEHLPYYNIIPFSLYICDHFMQLAIGYRKKTQLIMLISEININVVHL